MANTKQMVREPPGVTGATPILSNFLECLARDQSLQLEGFYIRPVYTAWHCFYLWYCILRGPASLR